MKMLHVTIQTARFEEEIAFYRDVVGLTIRRDARPGRNMVFLSDSEGDTEIEIIGNPESADAGNAFLSVGFRTGDAEAFRAELEAKGFAPGPMTAPGPGVKFFFVRDPAGVNVQFM